MYILQDPRLIATDLFYLNANKLLYISYIILYTWTVAGDGGIYIKSFFGRAHPLAALLNSFIFFCLWPESLDPPGRAHPFFKAKILQPLVFQPEVD